MLLGSLKNSIYFILLLLLVESCTKESNYPKKFTFTNEFTVKKSYYTILGNNQYVLLNNINGSYAKILEDSVFGHFYNFCGDSINYYVKEIDILSRDTVKVIYKVFSGEIEQEFARVNLTDPKLLIDTSKFPFYISYDEPKEEIDICNEVSLGIDNRIQAPFIDIRFCTTTNLDDVINRELIWGNLHEKDTLGVYIHQWIFKQ